MTLLVPVLGLWPEQHILFHSILLLPLLLYSSVLDQRELQKPYT